MGLPGVRPAVLVLLLAPAAPALGDPAALGGLWDVSVVSTTHAPDGSQVKSKVKRVLAITDFGVEEVSIASFVTGDGRTVPATTGVRFVDSFAAKSFDATIAGTVRVDPATQEGLSFKAEGSLVGGEAIVTFRLKGKRIPGSVPPTTLLLFEHGFEAGIAPYVETDANGLLAATLWHAEGLCGPAATIPASMGAAAAAYNLGDQAPPVYNYDTGFLLPNVGALEGPPLSVPSSSSPVAGIQFSFDFLRETEATPLLDECFLEVRAFECGGWTPVTQITGLAGCGASPIHVEITGDPALNGMLGKTFSHRFRFDTVDPSSNAFLGWYVDNVRIEVVNP